jgi:hypothetical protein
MIEWLFQVLLWLSVAIGALLTLLGLVGFKPNGYLILALGLVEVSLLIQLAVSFGMVLAGAQAVVSTLEYFGYLLVALLIPVAAAIWALAERSRWSTVIMGAAVLTVSVMLVRMWQIWTGFYPGAQPIVNL